MSADDKSSTGVKSGTSSLSGTSGFRWAGGAGKPARSQGRFGRLRHELNRLLSIETQRGPRPVQHVHDEAAFRLLLANELKRSERSGRSFHILLAYLKGFEVEVAPIESPIITGLLPILSGVVRETDYIGWYRDRHILGGVLTAWGDHSIEQVSGRIEQRFWRRIGHEFPAMDCTQLRLRFYQAQEFGRIESAGPLLELS